MGRARGSTRGAASNAGVAAGRPPPQLDCPVCQKEVAFSDEYITGKGCAQRQTEEQAPTARLELRARSGRQRSRHRTTGAASLRLHCCRRSPLQELRRAAAAPRVCGGCAGARSQGGVDQQQGDPGCGHGKPRGRGGQASASPPLIAACWQAGPKHSAGRPASDVQKRIQKRPGDELANRVRSQPCFGCAGTPACGAAGALAAAHAPTPPLRPHIHLGEVLHSRHSPLASPPPPPCRVCDPVGASEQGPTQAARAAPAPGARSQAEEGAAARCRSGSHWRLSDEESACAAGGVARAGT